MINHYRFLQKELKAMKNIGRVSRKFLCNQKLVILQAEYDRAINFNNAKAEWEKETKRQKAEQAKRAADEYESWVNACFHTTYEMPVGNSWDTDFRTALTRGYCEAEAKNCADILKNQPTSKTAKRIKESIYA
jgi:hypothetical protein